MLCRGAHGGLIKGGRSFVTVAEWKVWRAAFTWELGLLSKGRAAPEGIMGGEDFVVRAYAHYLFLGASVSHL